jgi:hypothetical protein
MAGAHGRVRLPLKFKVKAEGTCLFGGFEGESGAGKNNLILS